MAYILLALVAHFMNAVVFAVDKGLLVTKSSISQPVRYAAMSGLVASGAALLLVVSFEMPTYSIVMWSLLSGLWWVGALYFFFTALSKGEPSVVVPITGSAVPVFTLLAAALFLGERLSEASVVGVLMLVLGGLFLSVRWSAANKVSWLVIGSAIFSGALFALYFATVKYIYSFFSPFLAAFAYSRMGVGVVALVLLGFVVFGKGTKLKKESRRRANTSWIIAIAFVSSKVLAMVALLLQNYAISLGSVTIVNSLQGVQYLFVLLLAAAISKWWPVYREELNRVVVTQKVVGIICVGFGLILLTA